MATITTAIKITSLADIGGAISPSTVIPVVNLQGMPTTQKANLQITGNLILAGAGSANFVPAGLANLAYSVTNAAQPNITSVGTLTSLTVTGTVETGDINATGNITCVGDSTLGNAVTANYFIGDGSAILNVGSLTNGTSNLIVNPSANVTISSNGNANIVVVTGTGAVVSGNLRATNVISNALTSNNYGNINVSAGASSWMFTNSGNLRLPGNTWQVNYANGDTVPLGGAVVGNFTFNNDTLSTSDLGNTMYITAPTNDGSSLAPGSSLEISAGYTPGGTDGAAGTLILNGGNTDGNSSAGSVNINAGIAASNAANSGNIVLNANSNEWIFDLTGNLNLPSAGNLVSNGNAWTFSTDGTFLAPGNGVFYGNTLFVGNGANTLDYIQSTLIISASDIAYVQASITNVSDIGSADWVAYGHRGDDTGGWVDMGFTSSGYSDPFFTLTGQGDGYLLVQSFVDGQSPGGRGGNLILATGENGTVKDIIFATGGFAFVNEFARISDANNALEFYDFGNISGANVITANYFSGDGSNVTNVPISWTGTPGSNISTGTPGQVAYDIGGNLFICVDTDIWTKITGTTSW